MKIPEPRKLKSGNYFIQLRLNGVSVPVTASTAKACKDKAAVIKSEHRAGQRLISDTSSTITLDAAVDSYIANRDGILSASTIRGYRIIQRTRFQPEMSQMLNKIKWQRAVNREAALCSPKTLKNSWGFINSVLRENGVFVENIRLPVVPPSEKKWLTPEQIPVFLDAVKGRPYEIGALLALSGLRLSEVLGLDWRDIDMKQQTLYVHRSRVMNEDGKSILQARNKNRSSTRYVPILIPQLYDALNNVPLSDRQGNVVNYHQNTLYKLIQDRCATVGLPSVGIHGLRHSFTSICYNLGIDELTCMKLGGWSDYQTMRKIYTHLSDKALGYNVEKLRNFFNNANENANGS